METVKNEENILKVRTPNFQFDEVPKHWILNNPILTHFINSMHIVFPDGEKFFIRSVRKYARDVKNPNLKKNIKGFCGQEGVHAREHERFWDVMQEQGLQPEGFADFLHRTAFEGPKSLEKRLVKLFERFSPGLGDKMTLSITAGLEHYTAILAQALFREPLATNKNIAPQMLELLHWHASEEIEHKAVCFDVLKEVDDSYVLRISGMGLATVVLWSYLGIGQIYFISKDKDIAYVKMPAHLYEFITTIAFGEIGKTLATNLLSYFRPDFHPNDIDDGHFAKEFFADKSYA
ncbi:MAG: metal-dependent hydrolase [Chitinophagales bacterium]|nr:metal-dependent hydrolase [Chitinophagales bacterium]